MTKVEVIKKVNESAGSLFTKQDVINLVNGLEVSGINLETFKDRVLAIIDDSDTSAIEVDQNNCSFEIRNGNEIRVEDVELDTDDYIRSIKHDIEELFDSMEAEEVEEVQN
jgi:RNA binding exosome subunit